MGSSCCKNSQKREGKAEAKANAKDNAKAEATAIINGDRENAKGLDPESKSATMETPALEKKGEKSPQILLGKDELLGIEATDGKKNCDAIEAIQTSASSGLASTASISIDIEFLAQASNKLAIVVYQKISTSQPNENVVFSPLSITLALALVESAASGKARQEIQKLISPRISDEIDFGKSYGSLLEKVLHCPETDGQLRIANAFFRNTEVEVRKSYMENQKNWLNPPNIMGIPFGDDSEKARQQINRLISEKTAGKIAELFKPGQLSDRSAFVLANAAYLKMDWQTSMGMGTYTDTFYSGDGSVEQKVPFMTLMHFLGYAERPNLQVSELPYKRGAMSMYIILPRRKNGIEGIERQLNADFLRELFLSTKQFPSTVTIPKFTLRSGMNLLDTVSKLGFCTFDRLTRISSDPKARLSEAIHESYIKVDEKGGNIDYNFGVHRFLASQYDTWPRDVLEEHFEPPRRQVDHFKADHPFMFVVMHKPTWTIVFIGKVLKVENEEQ